MAYKVPEQLRANNATPAYKTNAGDMFGAFIIPPSLAKKRPALLCLASNGLGWEHVSVSTPTRCPTWEEMSLVKSYFWDEEDCVMQLHPPKENYINNHKFCLHLWRPVGAEIPQPDWLLVGIK